MTAQVTVVKLHIIEVVPGSQGKAGESRARQASPPSTVGTTNAVTTIIGAPTRRVTMTVRRGSDGINAARIATIMAIPPSGTIVKKASAIRVPSAVTIEWSRINPANR